MQTSARNAGGSDVVTVSIRTICAPLANGFTNVANSWSDFLRGLLEASSLSAENRRLRSLEQAAGAYAEQIRRYETEITRLRQTLSLPDTPGKSKVPAAIVGYFPLESRATLDRGHEHGVRKGMPVVAAEGLVGIVQTVDRRTCQVLLISSAQFRLAGMVQRDPAPVGFIRGLSPGAMVFEVLESKSVVQNGDFVVTSGFSERVPAGIPIGKIVQIEEDLAFGSRRCQVFPAVQIGSVREVFVLR